MKYDAEIEAVKELGERIGYGNMMEIASALWSRELNDYDGNGISVGAFIPVLFCSVNSHWWSLVKESTLKSYKQIEYYFKEKEKNENNN